MLLFAAALALAAPAPQAVPAKPANIVAMPLAAKACATQMIHTGLPQAKLDRPAQGSVERRPHRGEPTFLVSAVERTVDGCPAPVVRVRYGAVPVQPVQGKAAR